MGESEEKKKKSGDIKDKGIPEPEPTQHESTPHDSTYRFDLLHSNYNQRGGTRVDYFPSGSSYPWTDLTTDDKWPSSDYIKFLKDPKTKDESSLKFNYKELEKIEAFTKKEQCHSYRLGKNKSLAFYDSLLILFDSILKILPVVMLSSLPLLLLNNIASPTSNLDMNLLLWIYGIMISAVIVSLGLRWIFKNEFMIREQYIISVNKKEEEIVELERNN